MLIRSHSRPLLRNNWRPDMSRNLMRTLNLIGTSVFGTRKSQGLDEAKALVTKCLEVCFYRLQLKRLPITT